MFKTKFIVIISLMLLSILQIGCSSHSNNAYNQSSQTQNLDIAAKLISDSIIEIGKKSVAIRDFTDITDIRDSRNTSETGRYVAQQLSKSLVNLGEVNVVEADFTEILAEFKRRRGGLTNPTDITLGKALNVDIIITGVVTKLSRYKEDITIKVIDVYTAKIIASTSIKFYKGQM